MPSRLSTEYWKVPVSATRAGRALDLTRFPVYIAILPDHVNPAVTDWRAATWEISNGLTYARILVGPQGGAFNFATGIGATRYTVWVRVVETEETPILRAGHMSVS
jgi:hypothetical protein